jgi:biopolymer transport protein ExbB
MNKLHLILLSILLMVSGSANAWWNDDWNFRKQIRLDTTATGADIKTSLNEVPVLVRLHAGNFSYFLDAKPDGSDLRFIAKDDKTPLKFHVEKFDPINSMALIWVKLPTLVATSATESIWMYYGNPEAVATSDKAGSYDVNHAAVFHLDQVEGDPITDATAYQSVVASNTLQPNSAGLIGQAAILTGEESLVISAAPHLRYLSDNGFTFSAWIKKGAGAGEQLIFSRQSDNQTVQLAIDDAGLFVRYTSADNVSLESERSAALTGTTWEHIAMTMAADGFKVYVNGSQVTTLNTAAVEMGGDIYIGKADEDVGFIGEIDEIQLHKTARSADWLALAYRGEGPLANLVAYGEDEQHGSGGGEGSYFGVIVENVTFDGWIVIFILIIMFGISMMVMLGKAMVIRRVQSDNNRFLSDYRQNISQDPDALDSDDDEDSFRAEEQSPLGYALFGKHDHYQSSTLYHLFHNGMHEVHARIGSTVGAQATGVSAKSLVAIRAALDASLVRETQKLNSQMVLLTIAISGGPFLGLLGTVVGVMITFAAIAASGDVNINSIAPGIAAALLATVAGLAVAIPALFGYNYLGSKIKETVADMHVFVDEFIGRIGEHYGTD